MINLIKIVLPALGGIIAYYPISQGGFELLNKASSIGNLFGIVLVLVAFGLLIGGFRYSWILFKGFLEGEE